MPDIAPKELKLHFDSVFYHVSDIERSIVFYRDVLGFRLISRDYVARFDVDGVLFELVPSAVCTTSRSNDNARLSLGAKDLQEATAALQANGVATTPIKEELGGLLAYFNDPDGNELCLWQATTVVHRKQLRTVCDPAGVPILEIVKSEDGDVTIFEGDDMDNRLQFPSSVIPALMRQLEALS